MKILTKNGNVVVAGGNAVGVEDIVPIDSTRVYAYIDSNMIWRTASDSYSVVVPIEIGEQYVLVYSNTDSADVGTIFRFGQTNSSTPASTNTLTGAVRSTPQDTPSATITASKQYLIVQFAAGKALSLLQNGYFTIRKVI